MLSMALVLVSGVTQLLSSYVFNSSCFPLSASTTDWPPFPLLYDFCDAICLLFVCLNFFVITCCSVSTN